MSSVKRRFHRLTSAIVIFTTITMSCRLESCSTNGNVGVEDEANTAIYTSMELGDNTIDLLADSLESSPYCVNGCLSLDPHWHGHRVDPNTLPASPINYKQALGVTNTTPDLATIYVVSDELYLRTGSKVSYQVNDDIEVNHCLNNPGRVITDNDTSCRNYEFLSPNLDDDDHLLSIEKDLYGDEDVILDLSPDFENNRYSGTIIFAKKIHIIGEVRTGGYDLVLVADEIEFYPNSKIITTPPDRPRAGSSNEDSGMYDYGCKKDGYRGGDVVLFVKNVTGSVAIDTTGGKGQKECDNFAFDVGQFEWFNVYYEWFPDDNWLSQFENPDNLPERWFIDHHVFNIEDQGRGGRGGEGGNVTIVSTGLINSSIDIEQSGGDGADSAKSREPIALIDGPNLSDADCTKDDETRGIILPNGVDPDPEMLEDECLNVEVYGGFHVDRENVIQEEMLGPEPMDCGSGLLTGLIVMASGTTYCTMQEPYPHSNCHIDDVIDSNDFHCIHEHTQLDNIADPYMPGVVEEPTHDAPTEIVETENGLITCSNTEEMECVEYTPILGGLTWVFGKTGVDGPNTAQMDIRYVGLAANILPQDQNADIFVTSDNDEMVQYCQSGTCLTAEEYIQGLYAFVPRAVEVYNHKGDNLYRALSDQAILDNDSAYVSDADRNPSGINRIKKSQWYYASAAHYCVNEILGEGTADGGSSNPYWNDCQYALTQKEKLDAGLNYFGFEPGFYLYLKPGDIRDYFDSIFTFMGGISNDFQNRRGEYEDASNNLTNYGIDNMVLALELQEAEKSVELAAEEVNSASTRLEVSLERIDENSELIENTQDELEGYIDALESALEPPPCDFLCWVEKVFSFVVAIGELVGSIFSFNFGSVFESLENAFTLVQEAASFGEGVESLINYAGTLFKGEAVDSKGEPFEFNFSETGEGISDAAEDLASAWEDIEDVDANPLADMVVKIRTNSQDVSSNLQSNLTDIYELQASIEDNPQAVAIAKSMEDLTKYLQALNRQIPEFQRQHVIAAADVLVAGLKYELAEQRLKNIEAIGASQDDLLRRYLDTNEIAIVNSELVMDNTCGYARMITDRALLINYLLDRALAYLRLDSAASMDFNSNILIHDELNDMFVRDIDDELNIFVEQELHPERQPQVVVEYLVPAEYELNISIGAQGTTYQYLDRNGDGLQDALCPGGNDPCSLTKVAYHQEALEELRNSHALSFELLPTSLEGFKALSQDDQEAWNLGFTQADANYYKKRVIDVSARLLFDDWILPDNTLIHELSIQHGPNAYFYLDVDGDLENFYFSSEPIRTACRSIEHITGDDLSCDSIEFFLREVSSPFDEIDTTFQALNTVTVEQFSSSAMFGTSLRGVWTIDISSIINSLESFDQSHPGYNGCTASNPCSAVEEFWLKFRGIEFKVFWVPIE